MNKIGQLFWVILLSLTPIIELRGAIPVAAAFGMPWIETYILCVIGNMIPIPFILLLSRVVLKWMKNSKVKFFNRIEEFLANKVQKNSAKVMRYASWGLMIFVAIPLPGTGAWTGALIAAVMNMRFKYALPMILLGVMIAGFIMTGVSYGFLGFLSFFA